MARFTPFLILCRRLFVGTTAAYLITSFSLGGSRAARPAFYVLIACWFIFLCLRQYWRHTPLSNTHFARSLHYLELLGFNLALTLFLAEFTLRAFALYSGSSILVRQTLDAYRLAPRRDYGEGLHGNSLGYPGPEFLHEKRAGVYRIAALGDSFAIGPAVPFTENYLTLLQTAQPGIEVYNFGVSGAGPREYHAILRLHALAFQPDLVLLSVFVGNDITESLPTPRHLDLRRHSLYQLFDHGLCLWRERRRRDEEGAESITDRFTAGALAPTTFREVEARRLAVCLDLAPAGLERKWQRALGYLGRMVSDCQHQRVPLACILIPDEFQVNPSALGEALDVAQIDGGLLDLQKPQRRLLAFFAERNVPCLDLLPSFKGVAETYAPRNTHWNLRGNRLAAEAIGKWIRALRGGTP